MNHDAMPIKILTEVSLFHENTLTHKEKLFAVSIYNQHKTQERIARVLGHVTHEALNSSVINHNGVSQKFKNWAGIHSCTPKLVFHPENNDEVRKALREAQEKGLKVKVIGSGHSPTDIAMTDDVMLVLDKMNKVLVADFSTTTVKLQAGITLHQLNKELDSLSFALSVLGSISDQTLAGAISTGTHGTGLNYQVIAGYIKEIEIMTANGEILVLSESQNPDIFRAAQCGIGALGIILTVTLQCEKKYYLRAIQEPSTLQHVLANINSHLLSSQHFRFWWFPHSDNCITWKADRVSPDTILPTLSTIRVVKNFLKSKVLGFHIYQFCLFIAKFIPALIPLINVAFFKFLFTKRKVDVGKMDVISNFDCLFQQYVSEWTIPVEKTQEALEKLKLMISENNLNVHFPVEVRFTKKDDIYLSPSYGHDCCWIGIIMYRPYGLDIAHQKYFAAFEKLMFSLGGRPHWAKAFELGDSELGKIYPKWKEFKAIRAKLDPNNLFMNKHLERIIK